METRRRPSLNLPANRAVLDHLVRVNGRERSAEVRWPHEVTQPYFNLGSHPDVVARLWEAFNAVLPADCRAVVCHTPVLLHSDSGTLFAFGAGTSYVLWVPPAVRAAAAIAGLHPTHAYGRGRVVDLQPLGSGWLFGAWRPDEVDWCAAAYAELGESVD
jgi:hypothetical protein